MLSFTCACSGSSTLRDQPNTNWWHECSPFLDYAIDTRCHAGDRLASVMNGKRTLLHANHGVIVCTETVAEAFDYLYYLEKAAQITVKAMSTGQPLQLIPEDVCRHFHTEMEPPHLVKVHSCRLPVLNISALFVDVPQRKLRTIYASASESN